MKAKIATWGRGRKTILQKKNMIVCPSCGKKLQRSVLAIQHHNLVEHQRKITEGEAYRIGSPQKKARYASYTEGVRKSPLEVSGGLPSLGK